LRATLANLGVALQNGYGHNVSDYPNLSEQIVLNQEALQAFFEQVTEVNRQWTEQWG
jgi:uncharacterized protein YdaL